MTPSLNKAIISHSIHVLFLHFFHLEHKNQDLLIIDCTSTINRNALE
jgi:hypothetical protein